MCLRVRFQVQELLGIMPAGRGGMGYGGQQPQQQAGVPGMGGARDPAIGRCVSYLSYNFIICVFCLCCEK